MEVEDLSLHPTFGRRNSYEAARRERDRANRGIMTTFVDPKDPNAATLAAQNAKAADVASVRLAAEKDAAYREAAASQKASDITKTEADRVAKLKSEAATAAQAAANAGFIPAPVFNGPFPQGNPGSNGQFYSGNPNFPVSVGPNASASSRVVQVSSATNASGTPPLPSYGFHAINPATSAGANPPNPTSAGSVPPHTYPDPTETVVVSNQPLVNQYAQTPQYAQTTSFGPDGRSAVVQGSAGQTVTTTAEQRAQGVDFAKQGQTGYVAPTTGDRKDARSRGAPQHQKKTDR